MAKGFDKTSGYALIASLIVIIVFIIKRIIMGFSQNGFRFDAFDFDISIYRELVLVIAMICLAIAIGCRTVAFFICASKGQRICMIIFRTAEVAAIIFVYYVNVYYAALSEEEKIVFDSQIPFVYGDVLGVIVLAMIIGGEIAVLILFYCSKIESKNLSYIGIAVLILFAPFIVLLMGGTIILLGMLLTGKIALRVVDQ